VASPNPEGSESDNKATSVQSTRREHDAETPRDTQPLRPNISEHNTNYSDQEHCQTTERFAVFKLALSVVLTFATVGAFAAAAIYACYAKQQVMQMTNSVNQQVLVSRPVVIQNRVEVMLDGDKTRAWITFRNFGKSLAVRAVAPGHLFVADRRPFEPDCRNPKTPPKGGNLETIAIAPTEGSSDRPWSQSWSLADPKSLADFGKVGNKLYIVGCVYYTDMGGERHRSKVCLTWEPTRTTEPYPPCTEPDSNKID
jgi:hypothetical protein